MKIGFAVRTTSRNRGTIQSPLSTLCIDVCAYRGSSRPHSATPAFPTRHSAADAMIAVYEWGAYLGDEGLRKGIRCKVSSFTRGGLNSTMSKGKICGRAAMC